MSTIIRAAEPEDSDFLSWCIETAGRGHEASGFWDVVMPDASRRSMLTEWLVLSDVRSTCHFSNFLIAEVDGAAAAALAVYDGGDPELGSLAPAILDAFEGYGWSESELGPLLSRIEPYRLCAPPAEAGALVVEWVATSPQFRRLRLVQRLLARALQDGRDAGLSMAQISIMMGNEPAAAAYARAGFRIADEARHPRFEATFGAPGMVRMTQRLDASAGSAAGRRPADQLQEGRPSF